MQNLDLQPKMVGREDELRELQSYLERAMEGQGRTIFISGEAGIGKTRLVNELKEIAQSKGFQILSGNCMYESLTPFMPIMEALRSVGLESLFAEEAPRVEAVYLVTNAGILIRNLVREETELNPDVFASMFTTITDFLNESLSKLSGEEEKGTLNSLGYQNYRILIDNYKDTNLVVILTGRENEFLLNDMREILLKITKTFKRILEKWGGDEKKVAGIDELLKPLITSGKYDGIYYGKDDPKIRRNLLFENVSLGLIRQAQQMPTLLCIEDLQWTDLSSLALMHYLARNTRETGLFIMGTYRPEDVASMDEKSHPLVGTMQLMDREDLLKKMELARLPEEIMDEFLSVLLGKIDFTDEFKNRIYKETEGNPLFFILLIKFLVDEKIILEDEGTWKLAKDLKDIEIPSKIYNVIERRLNRLEKEDRKVLDYASIIGETFTSSILTYALDTNRTQLLEQLRSLEQVHRLLKSHNGYFKFDHAKVKEVLYSEIPEELRRDYHSIIANSVETLSQDNLDEVVEDLAFHYYQCKNKDKALHYLLKAAEKAKKDYSNEESIRFYSYALGLEDNPKKRRKTLEEMAGIYSLIGDYQNSIKAYERALELSIDNKKKAEIKIGIGNCHRHMGGYNESIKICNEALFLVRDEECREKADALNLIGTVHQERGEIEMALGYYDKSLKIREIIEDKKGIAGSLNNIGIIHMWIGKYNEALEYYKKSLGISEQIGDMQFTAIHMMNIGIVHVEIEEYDKALEYYDRTKEIHERMGDQKRIAVILHNIGVAHFYKGEYDKALDQFEKSMKIVIKIGYRILMAYNYWFIAEAYLRKKDLTRAFDFCKRSFELSKEIGSKVTLASSRRILGIIFTNQGKWKESIENFEESVKIFKGIGIKRELAESHFEFGLMWKAKGDPNKAKEQLNKAIDIYKELKLEKKKEKVRAALKDL
ncbi:MAG: DUF2791 family P-loop domain-containing protein [Thermoplasmata archaeon]|nr:MAG: DUF2791 family P-loop domain-containing protein [Thermoplasmata archaeon]